MCEGARNQHGFWPTLARGRKGLGGKSRAVLASGRGRGVPRPPARKPARPGLIKRAQIGRRGGGEGQLPLVQQRVNPELG